jgi:peptidoglycan/xylan/chitin deacetylase (PgdA/CDA1 family)
MTDGIHSSRHGVPVLNAHDIKGSFYIISGAMTRPGDGYATSTTILNAQSVGHEIGAHTVKSL